MAVRELGRNEWKAYFDRVSRALVGKRAMVEAASLRLGDQMVADWVPLIGISYDPRDNLVEIALAGLDHLIRSPRVIFVDEDAHRLASLEIVDDEDQRQIVRLADPLMLPPPGR